MYYLPNGTTGDGYSAPGTFYLVAGTQVGLKGISRTPDGIVHARVKGPAYSILSPAGSTLPEDTTAEVTVVTIDASALAWAPDPVA